MIFGLAGFDNSNRLQLTNKFAIGKKIEYYGDILISFSDIYFRKVDVSGGDCFDIFVSDLDPREKHYLDSLHFPSLNHIPHFLQNSLRGGFFAVGVNPNEIIFATDRMGYCRIFYHEKNGNVIFSDSFSNVMQASGTQPDPTGFTAELGLILPFGGSTNFNGINVLNMNGSAHISRVSGIFTVSASNTYNTKNYSEIKNYENARNFLIEKIGKNDSIQTQTIVIDGSLSSMILPAIYRLSGREFAMVNIYPVLGDLNRDQLRNLFPESESLIINTDKHFELHELITLTDKTQPLPRVSELAFWKIFSDNFIGRSSVLPFNSEILTGKYYQHAGFRLKASLNTRHVKELNKYFVCLPDFLSDEIKFIFNKLIQTTIEKEFEILPPIEELGALNWLDLSFSYRSNESYFSSCLNIIGENSIVYQPFTDPEIFQQIIRIDQELKSSHELVNKLIVEAFPGTNLKQFAGESVFDLPRVLQKKSFFKKQNAGSVIEIFRNKFFIKHKEMVCDLLMSEKILNSDYYNSNVIMNMADNLNKGTAINPTLDLLFGIELLKLGKTTN